MAVVLVCGPPGVGKTTVATALRDRLADRGRRFEFLHFDDFARDTYRRMYDRVAGSDADWIVDGTFYEREWQTLFQRLDDAVRVVYLRAALETCLERNRRRADPISETGLRVVFHEFDPPRADVTVEVTDRTVEETVDQVLEELASFGSRFTPFTVRHSETPRFARRLALAPTLALEGLTPPPGGSERAAG